MCATTTRPATPARPCRSCGTAEAMDAFPRCLECHRREWRAAYKGPVHAGLRRVIALAAELNALCDDLIGEMADPGFARTNLARFMGEDDVYFTVRDLRAIEYATNAGVTFQNSLYGDPNDD